MSHAPPATKSSPTFAANCRSTRRCRRTTGRGRATTIRSGSFSTCSPASAARGCVVAGAAALRREVDRIAAERRRRAHLLRRARRRRRARVEWEAIDDPYDLADVDLAIVPGELAVAENAAVWVTDAALPQRSAYFLSQHLVLVVPADRLVHNMHEAYAWLAAARRQAAARSPNRMFGTFLSGPSKTADIEQALVIGAHGARSLHVLLYVAVAERDSPRRHDDARRQEREDEGLG